MIKYLEKYKNISPEIRAKITTPKALGEVKALEKKYQIDMGILIIRLMVKDLQWVRLVDYLINDLSFSKIKAEALKQELKTKIFSEVLDYLEQKSTENFKTNTKEKKVEKTVKEKKYPQEVVLKSKPLINKITTEEKEAGLITVNDVDSQIDKVVKKTNLKFSSQFMETRFRQILITYLKGIRNKIDTKATIIKPFDVGGLGLDTKSAERILNILDNANRPNQTKIKPPARIKLPEDRKEFATRDSEYNLKTAVKDKPILRQGQQNQLTEFKKRLAPADLVVASKHKKIGEKKEPKDSVVQNQAKLAKNKLGFKKQPIIKPAPRPNLKRKVIRKVEHTSSGKIKMDDIKVVPKVLSPVDELHYMNMRNFRNLNPNPERRIEIILEKLELFRKDEYAKKVAGIKAWKLSPVNRAYVNILKSSISNGQPINTVINNELKRNPNFMTQDEFNAIMSLNKQIDY